jgi:NADPH:quinone reductase-like Zn-dependent oxidoreductase
LIAKRQNQFLSIIVPSLPSHFNGVGYTKEKNSLPLESIRVPVPQPSANQVLIHVYSSSLNPLEYKLALLNFFGRTPPLILGFDLSGIVVAVGANVKNVAVGDEVMAMADSNKEINRELNEMRDGRGEGQGKSPSDSVVTVNEQQRR